MGTERGIQAWLGKYEQRQEDVNTYSLVHMIRRGIPMTFSMAWSYGTRLGGSYVDIVGAGSSYAG